MAKEANPIAQPLHHSDRGFQYTRAPFKNMLEEYGMTQSMSRVSRCIDNGPMESVQGIIKEMLFILYPSLSTYEELVDAIGKTIKYYNEEYPQKRFNGLTPSVVRERALNSSNPVQYPIKHNPALLRFWKRIDELKRQVF